MAGQARHDRFFYQHSMKIAILSPFYPYRGGIAQFSAMLYQALGKEHEVKAFSFSRLYPGFLFPGKTQFVDEIDADFPVSAERHLDSIHPFSYEKTAKAIEKFQPDVLLIAYWMSFFGPAYGYIAHRLKNKTKIITLVHNAIPHEPKFFDKAFSKLLFDRTQGFLVLSDTVKNDILSLYPQANVCLKAHPLYDHFGAKMDKKEALQTLGLDSAKKTLLFFGLIRDYKGLDLLIDAMSLLDDSYQLLIAGECYGSFEKYQQQIAISSAKERIQVLNKYVDDREVPVLFSAADLLVLPYKSATQSGVVPVAYHFETPIVATDVGSLKESIETTETGLICSPETGSLAQTIEKAFQQGTDQFIVSIQKEKQNLSWDVFAEAFVTFALSLRA
jgi:glycosyltransferase involved in cell wall biosynthesis